MSFPCLRKALTLRFFIWNILPADTMLLLAADIVRAGRRVQCLSRQSALGFDILSPRFAAQRRASIPQKPACAVEMFFPIRDFHIDNLDALTARGRVNKTVVP